MSNRYTPEERALLSQYVSDLEGDVYCIYNLPEEVIAVIFAYVSRSPDSFRDNLLKLLRSGDLDLMSLPGAVPGIGAPGPDGGTGTDGAAGPEAAAGAVERARRFHERYTVGYGHASVAEHAVVRVGIERVSRYASSLLETANPFLSFTEYSQRYQRPRRGAYYIPPELDGDPSVRRRYIAFQERAFDVYEELLPRLHAHLLRTEPMVEGESEAARSRRLEKLAFEDARYALTLATHTNLGMTGNARAIRDALVVLVSHPAPEAQSLARRIKEQVQRVVPTLLRYAEANDYRMRAAATGRSLAGELGFTLPSGGTGGGPGGGREGASPAASAGTRSSVRLLDWTGRAGSGEARAGEPGGAGAGGASSAHGTGFDGAGAQDEAEALDRFLAAAVLEAVPGADSAAIASRLAGLSLERKREWVRSLLAGLGPHDNPPDGAHRIRYSVEFSVSEANWHQLLRHSRRIDFVAEPPHPGGGVTIPPRIEEAGLAAPLVALAEEAADAWHGWAARVPEVRPYVVLNAHRRRAWAELNLWELYHVVNLRTSPEAQWDIREAITSLYEAVARVHPTLVAAAPRRAGKTEEMVFGGKGSSGPPSKEG